MFEDIASEFDVHNVIYLVVAIAITLTAWFATTRRGIERILSTRYPPRLVKTVTAVSAILLIILLLDEIGGFLEEWGWPQGPLAWLRKLEGMPGFAHLIYLANMFLLAPATFKILQSKRNNVTESLPSIGKMNLAATATFVSLSLIVTSVQSLVFNELNITPAIFICVLMSVVTLRCLKTYTRYSEETSKDISPIEEIRKWDIWVLVFGLVMLQTMVTKAGLLLLLIPRLSGLVMRIINRVLPTTSRRNLPQPINIETLPKRIWNAELMHRIAYYALLSSGLSCLFLWQFHQSPFPPADSGFPKTQTLSLLYTIDILFIISVLASQKHRPILLSLSIGFLFLSRYGTILAFPDWFVPPLDPPGFNTVEGISSIFKSLSSVVWIGIVIHLMAFAVFFIQERYLRYGQFVLVDKQDRYMKNLFWWRIVLVSIGFVGALALSGFWMVALRTVREQVPEIIQDRVARGLIYSSQIPT